MSDAKIVTMPVTASDFKISLELLFQVINENIAALLVREEQSNLQRPNPKANRMKIKDRKE